MSGIAVEAKVPTPNKRSKDSWRVGLLSIDRGSFSMARTYDFRVVIGVASAECCKDCQRASLSTLAAMSSAKEALVKCSRTGSAVCDIANEQNSPPCLNTHYDREEVDEERSNTAKGLKVGSRDVVCCRVPVLHDCKIGQKRLQCSDAGRLQAWYLHMRPTDQCSEYVLRSFAHLCL